MRRWLRAGLVIWAYFTSIGLLLFGYRYFEYVANREAVPLQLYLDIMRQRFEDKLQVDVRIAPEVQKALAPHLLLQPLVENSIRHGIDPQSHVVTVKITAERDGDQTRLQVSSSHSCDGVFRMPICAT